MTAAGMVTVCSACRTEACWRGRLYCEDYRTAGTVDIPRPTIHDARSKQLAPSEAGELVIVVHGLPAAQGSKRHVGKGVMVESSKALKPWREAVKYAALELALDNRPYFDAGPLAYRIVFTFPRPKSHYRTGKHAAELRPDAPTYKSSAPDGSKLLRSTEDALTDAGIWRDDAQVAKCVGIKRYGTFPGAEITIRAMETTA